MKKTTYDVEGELKLFIAIPAMIGITIVVFVIMGKVSFPQVGVHILILLGLTYLMKFQYSLAKKTLNKEGSLVSQ